MIAIRKFVGGCLENVTLNNNNLEAVVGGMSTINHTMDAIVLREQDTEATYRQIHEIGNITKQAQKEITTWHTRATTEPGFMAPPPVEVEEVVNPLLKAFLEKKAIEDAAEAEAEEAERQRVLEEAANN